MLNLVGMDGLKGRADRVSALQDTLKTVEASIDSAKRELARGSVEDIRKRVEEYRATLTVLRQFVPEQNEVPNLLDDISTRAKIRGVNLSGVVPSAAPTLDTPATRCRWWAATTRSASS